MPIDEEVQEEFDGVDRRFKAGKDRMDSLEHQIQDNTKITQEIKEILEPAITFFKFLGYIGKFAKWVSIVGSAIAVIYAVAHGQVPPKE